MHLQARHYAVAVAAVVVALLSCVDARVAPDHALKDVSAPPQQELTRVANDTVKAELPNSPHTIQIEVSDFAKSDDPEAVYAPGTEQHDEDGLIVGGRR